MITIYLPISLITVYSPIDRSGRWWASSAGPAPSTWPRRWAGRVRWELLTRCTTCRCCSNCSLALSRRPRPTGAGTTLSSLPVASFAVVVTVVVVVVKGFCFFCLLHSNASARGLDSIFVECLFLVWCIFVGCALQAFCGAMLAAGPVFGAAQCRPPGAAGPEVVDSPFLGLHLFLLHHCHRCNLPIICDFVIVIIFCTMSILL